MRSHVSTLAWIASAAALARAQEPPTPPPATPPPQSATTTPAPAEKNTLASLLESDDVKVVPYGSFRVATGVNTDGAAGIVNNASRIGLNCEAPVTPDWLAIGRAEFGINLVQNDVKVDYGSGDPNGGVGQGADTITTRLGYLGLRADVGEFTWGKRWSVYYDYCSGWTDLFYVVGGNASGTYNNGTDGGISGTGRAETCFQYRSPKLGPVSAGVQAQTRSRTANDQNFADTWGAAVDVDVADGWTLGAAFNDVRDGVAMPGVSEPLDGDQSWIVGLRFERGKFYGALNYNQSKAHETDDAGTFFDAQGSELYASYKLERDYVVYGGFNWLQPKDHAYTGDFERKYVAGGFGRYFGKHDNRSVLFVECRIEDSTQADGSDGNKSVLGAGMRFNF